ncbi:MAG: hypothetical protein ABJD07_14625 [Gemmatimonadaceae bacterium]
MTALLAAVCVAADARAQSLGAALAPSAHGLYATRATDSLPPMERAWRSLPRVGPGMPRSWWSPVASAMIPGSGQVWLRQSRALPYVIVEAFAWTQYSAKLRAARSGRNEYRRLARVVARSVFSDSLPNGDFEYYETMERFVESGVFDLNPGGSLDPETDSTTFNGSVWLLARRTFWANPSVPPSRTSDAWRSAESFYLQRAVRPEYRWSWRNAQLEQDLFRRTIRESNGAARIASDYLGMIIANHVLSSIDAYVTVRLRRSAGPGGAGDYGIEGSIPWAPLGRRSRR